MNLTGDLVLERTYLMQSILPAGEYEVILSNVYFGNVPPRSSTESLTKTLRFEIEDGRTTGITIPLTFRLDANPRPPGR